MKRRQTWKVYGWIYDVIQSEVDDGWNNEWSAAFRGHFDSVFNRLIKRFDREKSREILNLDARLSKEFQPFTF